MYMRENRTDIRRGDVFYIRSDKSVGHELSLGRPGVVVSDPDIDRGMPIYTVALMTTSPKQGVTVTPVRTKSRMSYALCNQLYSYDESRLMDYMGTLIDSEMEALNESLRASLGLTRDNSDIEELKAIHAAEMEELKNTYGMIDEDNDTLEVERDLYKRLYEKVLDMLVAEKIAKITPDTEVRVREEKANPRKKENSGKKEASVVELTDKVNVNTATWRELRVVGINEQTARSIVQWRNKNGAFVELEDLLNVPRFGERCMKWYGDKLCVR